MLGSRNLYSGTRGALLGTRLRDGGGAGVKNSWNGCLIVWSTERDLFFSVDPFAPPTASRELLEVTCSSIAHDSS